MEQENTLGTIQISKDYGFVLLAIAGLTLQCFAVGFSVNFLRKKLFTREFMKENFGEEHKMHLGRGIGPMGYPDTGNGRYSQKLSYKDWYEFNLAQRSHLNFVEHLGVIVPLLLVAGLFYPILASIIGWFYFTGRLIYMYQYRNEGPRGRVFGSFCFTTSILGSGLLVIIGALDLINS